MTFRKQTQLNFQRQRSFDEESSMNTLSRSLVFVVLERLPERLRIKLS